jgi:hypothetical protein
MSNKRNVVLYLDDELVAKSKELGFNLSKTFENHLKMLINNFQPSIHKITAAQKYLVARGRFELPSEAPEASMIDRYTTGLFVTITGKFLFCHINLSSPYFGRKV